MNKAAQALGRLARGVAKNYSAEEIARRSKILADINARKRMNVKTTKWENAAETLAEGMRQLAQSPIITYYMVHANANSPHLAAFIRKEWAVDFRDANVPNGVVTAKEWCVTPGYDICA
jgi:hypothetical protein